MNKVQSDLLTWVDLETFGLDENKDPILEVGIKITTLNLAAIDSMSWQVWAPGVYDTRYKELVQGSAVGDSYVLNMHKANGLWDEARSNGLTPNKVEQEAINFLEKNNATGFPMCGSSVHYDQRFLRAQMPDLYAQFHYRIIDTSVLKELCRRYNPTLYTKLPSKVELHRTDSDLVETIQEFQFYRDEFLLW